MPLKDFSLYLIVSLYVCLYVCMSFGFIFISITECLTQIIDILFIIHNFSNLKKIILLLFELKISQKGKKRKKEGQIQKQKFTVKLKKNILKLFQIDFAREG